METGTGNPTDDNSTCAHPRCNCPVTPGEKYCCESCEKQQGDEACACGHVECQRE